MRHGVDGRKFGRNTPHRKAMLQNMAVSVIEQEQIITTAQKAKEAKRVVDRLITLGKKGTVHARRLAFARTRSKQAVEKLFGPLAERYQERAGGYTRVMRLSDRRRGDGAEMALFELVDHPKLNRKRPKPEQSASAAQGTSSNDAAKAKGADQQQPEMTPEQMNEAAMAQAEASLGRFRKLFQGKKKKRTSSAASDEGTESKTPSKKSKPKTKAKTKKKSD